MTMGTTRRLIGLVLACAGAAAWVDAAKLPRRMMFSPPADGPVAFRRDRVPLEATVMVDLSRSLGILVRGLRPETAVEFRGAAQMLALALALEPGSPELRGLVAVFERRGEIENPDPGQLVEARARVWQCVGWLESPEAGADGGALAACLKDVIVHSDPKDPRAKDLVAAGETGRWQDWVAPLSAYGIKPRKGAENPKPDSRPEDSAEEDKARKKAAISKMALESASIRTPLVRMERKNGREEKGRSQAALWSLKPANLSMSAVNGEKRFSIMAVPEDAERTMRPICDRVASMIRGRYPKVPHGTVKITFPSIGKRNDGFFRQSVSGPIAVLAGAAVTGIEPVGMIVGRVDDKGAYLLPSGFWYRLKMLDSGRGERLVLPAGAEAYLPAFLAMEKPGFFLENQVLLATDLDELLARCAKEPDPAVAKAAAMFREIQNRAAGQEVRSYVANRFVRQRLAEVAELAPYNISAKMLILQSSGNRPTKIHRAVLADELRRAIEPLVWISKTDGSGIAEVNYRQLGQVFDACRERIDPLAKVMEKGGEEMYESTMELINQVRNLERVRRQMGNDMTKSGAVHSSHTTFMVRYAMVIERLKKETTYR